MPVCREREHWDVSMRDGVIFIIICYYRLWRNAILRDDGIPANTRHSHNVESMLVKRRR